MPGSAPTLSSATKPADGPSHHRHRDRPIERDDGRWRAGEQIVVVREDARPVGRRVGRRERMAGGDARLEMIGRQFAATGRPGERSQPGVDHRRVPQGAILRLQQEEIARRVGAGGQARGVEQHQGEERVDIRPVARRMRREDGGEPDRLVAEIVPDERIPL